MLTMNEKRRGRKKNKPPIETITPTSEEIEKVKALTNTDDKKKRIVTNNRLQLEKKERNRVKDLFKNSLLNALQETNPENQKLYIDCINASAIEQAINGNVQAMAFIRDTIGEKPVDKTANTDSEGNDLPIYDFSKLSTADLMAIASKIGVSKDSSIIEAEYEVLE